MLEYKPSPFFQPRTRFIEVTEAHSGTKQTIRVDSIHCIQAPTRVSTSIHMVSCTLIVSETYDQIKELLELD